MNNDDFSTELQVNSGDWKDNFWITCVYANTEARIRYTQWESLKQRKQNWGTN